MTRPVHISPLSIANGTTIGLNSVKICPRPAHFSLRFLESDRLLSLTFKENCTDIRNSEVVDIIWELKDYGLSVHIHDPQADSDEADERYGLSLTKWDQLPQADAVVLAVAHREYLGMQIEALTASLQPGGCVIDVKSVLSRGEIVSRGFAVWRL